MGILKTLDRALAIGMAVGSLPAVGVIVTAVGAIVISHQASEGKLSEEDFMLVRTASATVKGALQIHKASMKQGFISAMLNPETQKENARASMEMAAEIQQLSAEEKAASLSALEEVLSKSDFGLAWILKDTWHVHERVNALTGRIN